MTTPAHRARRPVALTILAAVAALAAALAAPPAHAAKGMEVAIQDDAIFRQNWGHYDREAAYLRLAQLGIKRLRLNAIWHQQLVAEDAGARRKPRRLRYDFARLDDAIATARRHGVRVHLTITGPAPRWAAGSYRGLRIVRPNAREFGSFAATVARRYRGQVDLYSVWNEPNHLGWLAPVREQGRLYRELYYHGYRAIKKADRKARVLFGETAPYASKRTVATPPLQFLREVTCVDARYRYRRARGCRALLADGFAHHPYDFERGPDKRRKGDAITMANLSTLTGVLDRLRSQRRLRTSKGRALDLWLTEFGYFASKPGKVFSERTRGVWLARGFDMARRHPRVRSQLQYILAAPPPNSRFDTSLIDRSGRLTYPYRKLQAWIEAARKRRLVR